MTPHAARTFWYATTRLASAYAIFLGIGIIIGGQDRMPVPTYEPILAWADPAVWGGTLVVSATLTFLFKPKRLVQIACSACAVWFWLFTAAFFVAFVSNPHAAFTAWPTYAFVAVLWTVIGWAVAE